MRVKHKSAENNNSDASMPLFNWQKEYCTNKKYLNYEFYDVPEIFDLYEIDQTNGNLTYLTSDFANVIFPKVRENPTEFVYKEHNPKYLDEHLMPVNISYSGLPFFSHIIKIWNSIPKPKIISVRRMISTISKFTSNITKVVVGGLLILIIWALYQEQLIIIWKSVFRT
jgi:hypothetical protein